MNTLSYILAGVALMAGAAVAPGTARAQQRPKKIPRIGIIDDGAIWNPFRDALRCNVADRLMDCDAGNPSRHRTQ